MRPGCIEDLVYFIEAGREYSKETPFRFDAESYARNVIQLLNDPQVITMVTGNPVTGHSVARLTPSLYDESEIIGRVFTTWGKGGLRCFQEVERQCFQRGARFVMADTWIEPRLANVYRRRGYQAADSLLVKAR